MAKLVSLPKVDRPIFPDGYGIPDNEKGLLPWSYVEEHMKDAINYWICTANRRAVPAATPIWAVWVDGKLYFDGAPTTRRGRNIADNPKIVVHLESGTEVVILEGEAVILPGAPERSVAEPVSAEYKRKYGPQGYSPDPNSWDGGGLYIFTPHKGMGWSKFPDDVTRWMLR